MARKTKTETWARDDDSWRSLHWASSKKYAIVISASAARGFEFKASGAGTVTPIAIGTSDKRRILVDAGTLGVRVSARPSSLGVPDWSKGYTLTYDVVTGDDIGGDIDDDDWI